MTGRQAAVALVLGLFATSAAADNAVRRDGSSSGGSQGAGSRQPGAHSSGSSGSGSGGGSHSGGSGSAQTPAQRRQPRPGTGTGYHGGYHGGHYGGGYYPGYYPYYPYGYYGSYWWPYGSLYGGFYGGGYYPYGGAAYISYADADRGSLRLLVDQPKARVYVDGYYAGTVDDFDGLFQRLYVSPGRHDIAFKLDGYQTHRVKIYAGSGATLKLHHDMQKGSGPETVEDLAGDADDRYAQRDERRPYDQRYDQRNRDADDGPDDRPAPREDRAPSADRGPSSESGRLHLSVLPEDASIYVDGRFRSIARQAATLELAPGRHRVEVVRPGFRTEERDVDVEPGTTRELGIELQRP